MTKQPGLTDEFHLALPEPVPIRLDRAEHRAFEWVGVEDAVARVWSDTNQAALEVLSKWFPDSR